MTANKNEMIRSAEEMTKKSIHQISSVLIFCLSNSSIKKKRLYSMLNQIHNFKFEYKDSQRL